MTTQVKTMQVKSDVALAETTTRLTDMVTFDVSKLPNGITYKGLKAVLSFADPIEWNKASTYDSLTVVWDEATLASYASKRPVPAGIEITNDRYWLRMADGDAQIEIYRQEVDSYNRHVEELKEKVNYVFNTVSEMAAATYIENGMTVKTNGFNKLNDGGGAFYTINDSGAANGIDKISCQNGLIASLVYNDCVSLEQLGANAQNEINTILERLNKMECSTVTSIGEYYMVNNPIGGIDLVREIHFKGVAFDFKNSVAGLNIKANNISFENCKFKGGNQLIFLHNCSNIHITNNTFENTGYGVIQNVGTSSNYIYIIENTAINIYHDFIEMNGVSGSTDNVFIIGNYCTCAGTEQIENRFAGFTNSDNVVIANNIIPNVNGDAIIHVEGENSSNFVISGNIFGECNYGYGIYLIAKNMVNFRIENNILTGAYKQGNGIYCVLAGGISVLLSINNNTFNNATMNALDIQPDSFSKYGYVQVNGNTFNVDTVTNTLIDGRSGYIDFVNNTCNCNNFITRNGFSIRNMTIAGCKVTGIIGDYSIDVSDDVDGKRSNYVKITDNMFDKGLHLYYPEHTIIANNELGSASTIPHSDVTTFYAHNNTVNYSEENL